MGSRIFYKPKSYLKILGAWRVTCGKFHIKEPQILGVTVHNFDVGRQDTRGFYIWRYEESNVRNFLCKNLGLDSRSLSLYMHPVPQYSGVSTTQPRFCNVSKRDPTVYTDVFNKL